VKGSGVAGAELTLSAYSSDASLAEDLTVYSALEREIYSNWDASSVLMCNCDASYFGADCSLSMCPKGDDPWTTEQNDRSIGLVVTSLNSSIALSGLLGIKLFGETAFVSMSNATDGDCQRRLENSSQIEGVECAYAVESPQEHRLNLTFTAWPTFGIPDNNVYANDGNPGITDFFCDISLADLDLPDSVRNATIKCSFFDIQAHDIKGKASPCFPILHP